MFIKSCIAGLFCVVFLGAARSQSALQALSFSRCKLPKGFERAAVEALGHYPELAAERIAFKVRPSKLAYWSRPVVWSLLPGFEKRYKIIISSRSSALREPALLKNLAFDEQVGALGHELGHTAYYQRTSKAKLLADGFRYKTSFGFKARFEKMTDGIAIEHGLCPQLSVWSRAVWPIKLKDGRRAELYLSPEAIERRCRGPR